MTNVRKSDLTRLNVLEETLRQAVLDAYQGKLRIQAMHAAATKRDERKGLDHEYHGRDALAALEQAHAILQWALHG